MQRRRRAATAFDPPRRLVPLGKNGEGIWMNTTQKTKQKKTRKETKRTQGAAGFVLDGLCIADGKLRLSNCIVFNKCRA